MKKKHDIFIKMAFLLADESKCVSHHVGAVIVKEGRIIATGYNGSPPDLPNCCDVFDKRDFSRVEHSKWSADNEIHAEMNAILFAAKYDIGIEGCDMYTTISPCNECLKNITMSGIKNVYYLFKYDRIAMNPTLLQKVNVQEVPNAEELKKWVDRFGLLYSSKVVMNYDEMVNKIINDELHVDIEFIKDEQRYMFMHSNYEDLCDEYGKNRVHEMLGDFETTKSNGIYLSIATNLKNKIS